MHCPIRSLLPLLAALLPAITSAADMSTGQPVLTKPQILPAPALHEPAQTRPKDKPDNTQAPQVLQQAPPPPSAPATGETRKKSTRDTSKKHAGTPQNLPAPPGTGIPRPMSGALPALPEKTRKQLQAPRRDLPQVSKPSFTPEAPEADTVHIRLSGVGPYGGSTVGGDDGEALAVGRPGIIVLVRHGELWMHGVVPGERATYDYYLIVQPQAEGPGSCRVDPRFGYPTDVVISKPDIQGDGKVRLVGRGWDRQIRNVSMAQGATVNKYYIRLCVVGTRPETREMVSISSNIAQLAVLPD